MIPATIPHGRTARRLEWAHLPPHVRSVVEQRCGAPVESALSQTAGFTPGFASVLTCTDGSRHFVKAASSKAQRAFAEAYRQEARTLAALPPGVPAARLLWTDDTDDWFVLGLEYVESRQPRRPWRAADLDAALDALETVADLLTPAPPGLGLDPIAQEFGEFPGYWDQVLAQRDLGDRGAEAAVLAARFPEVSAGDTLVHTDVRDDNTLVRPDGTVVFCDWNFPSAGTAWIDSLLMLIGPRGDGLDVEAVLTERRLTRDLDAETVDIMLALLVGYFFRQCEEPVPPTSPHLRDAQRWQGEVCWAWLCERRAWVG